MDNIVLTPIQLKAIIRKSADLGAAKVKMLDDVPHDTVKSASDSVGEILHGNNLDRHEAGNKIHSILKDAAPDELSRVGTVYGSKATDHREMANELADRVVHNPTPHTAESAFNAISGHLKSGKHDSPEAMDEVAHIAATLDPTQHADLAKRFRMTPEKFNEAMGKSKAHHESVQADKANQFYGSMLESADKIGQKGPVPVKVNDTVIDLPGMKVGEYGIAKHPQHGWVITTPQGDPITNATSEQEAK